MAITSRKRYPNRVARRKISGVGAEAKRPRRTPISILGVTVSVGSANVQYDQDVSLAGVPQYDFGAAGVGTGATKLTVDTVQITGLTGTAVTVTVPFEDPAVRNTAGGFVTPQTLDLT